MNMNYFIYVVKIIPKSILGKYLFTLIMWII